MHRAQLLHPLNNFMTLHLRSQPKWLSFSHEPLLRRLRNWFDVTKLVSASMASPARAHPFAQNVLEATQVLRLAAIDGIVVADEVLEIVQHRMRPGSGVPTSNSSSSMSFSNFRARWVAQTQGCHVRRRKRALPRCNDRSREQASAPGSSSGSHGDGEGSSPRSPR